MSDKDFSDKNWGSLRLEGVQQKVSDFILAADLVIDPGQRAVLIGRSGSGKTTLLRLIAGLESICEPGRIWIGSEEITHLTPQKREIGVVFQDLGLFPSLDVLDNVTFALRMRGVSKEEREAQALPWLRKVGLEKLAHANIGRLSGGEAQRVAFVRALIWRPRVLLLDEPFSALDPGLRDTLRSELLDLHRLCPVPMILVSHDADDALQLATFRLKVSEEPLGFRRIRVE